MRIARMSITGMDHEGCADSLSDMLQAVSGVETVCVSLARNDATVQYDERVATPQRLLTAVSEAGFGGELEAAQAAIPCTGACGHCAR